MCECKGEQTTVKENCTCSSSELIVNPKTIKPITSSEEASNKYSIETVVIKMKAGSGSQKMTYVGVARTDTAENATADVRTKVVEVAVDVLRSALGEAYVGPVPSTVTDADVATLAAFKTYLNVAFTGQTPMDTAKINLVAETLYPLFSAIAGHLAGATLGVVEVCPSKGASRVYQFSASNCLFSFEMIFN